MVLIPNYGRMNAALDPRPETKWISADERLPGVQNGPFGPLVEAGSRIWDMQKLGALVTFPDRVIHHG